jgi:thioesterase domain-containing protein
MAAAFIRVLRRKQPKGPYQLAGLCVNGALAYEMACQLESQGELVSLLVLLDTQNPAKYWDYKNHRFQYMIQKGLFHLSKLAHSGESGFGVYLRQRWGGVRRRANALRWRLAGVPVDAHRMETPEDFDPVVHPASWRYRPRPFGGRVTLFQSTETPKGSYWNYELGWKALAEGGLEVIWLTGSHLGMFEDPNVSGMADHIRQQIGHLHTEGAVSLGA